jgi:hypothetical protein
MTANVFEALHRALAEREAKGVETYGGLLTTFNGRDAVKEAFEEALDLAAYLQQHKIENGERKELLERAVDALMEAHRIIENEPSPESAKLVICDFWKWAGERWPDGRLPL